MVADYEELRARHLAEMRAALPDRVERFDWPRWRIDAERTRRVREIVATAKARSPWHADRLAGVDVERLDARDLTALPVMSKTDLMAHFDDILTDRRLTLARAEDHLDSLGDGDAYLDDLYHVVASGGSSGRRGVFVWDWDGWTSGYLPTPALTLRDQARNGEEPAPALLAGEAHAGRLRIKPWRVIANAEPLRAEVRDAITAAWDPRIANVWGTSEAGITASGCFRSDGMHLIDDQVIIEPVDAGGNPVAPGERSAKVYLTNLINSALPLVRYELTDEITVVPDPCPCGCSFQRVADIEGRLDDVFVYGDVVVHPHVLRSAVGRDRAVLEYQVRQTARGVSVTFVCGAPPDREALRARLIDALAGAGLSRPDVVLDVAQTVPRLATGKLRRFVPLVNQDFVS